MTEETAAASGEGAANGSGDGNNGMNGTNEGAKALEAPPPPKPPEPPKQPEPPAKVIRRVMCHLSEDGSYYRPGDSIELTPERAAALGNAVGDFRDEDD